jgi:hypothetical protein
MNDISISSELPLNCTPVFEAYERGASHPNDTTHLYPSEGTYSCYGIKKGSSTSKGSKGSRLSANAIVGICLGVGIAGLLVFITLRFWYLDKKSKKQRKSPIPRSDGVELGDRNTEDLPPEYSSVVATEVGSLRSEMTAVNHVGDQEGSHNDSAHMRRWSEAANDGDVSPLTPVEGRNPFS